MYIYVCSEYWAEIKLEAHNLEQSLNLTPCHPCVKVDQITGFCWISEKAGRYVCGCGCGCGWLMAHSNWKYLVHRKELQNLYIAWIGFLWATFSSHLHDKICTGQGLQALKRPDDQSRRLRILQAQFNLSYEYDDQWWRQKFQILPAIPGSISTIDLNCPGRSSCIVISMGHWRWNKAMTIIISVY